MLVFLSPSDVLVRTSDGRNCVLQEPIEVATESGIRYRARIGSTTDGASTPPASWPELPPFGPYWKAAVLHDAAYRGTLEVQQADGSWIPAMLSKDACDMLLLDAMHALGVSNVTAILIYNGVRLAGANSFDRDRSQLASASTSTALPHQSVAQIASATG